MVKKRDGLTMGLSNFIKKKKKKKMNEFGNFLCERVSVPERILSHFTGDPKIKFLLLFLSSVRPSVRPKKILPTLPLHPTSSVRPPPSNLGPIQWGQSYTSYIV